MSSWDTSAPNSLNAVDLHKEVLLDFGTTDGMTGGIGVFVETVDKIGGTLQILHNMCPHIPRGNHRGTEFAYLNDIRSKDVEIIPFQEELLTLANAVVVTPVNMERMLELFASDLTANLVGPFADGDAATKKT